VDQEVGGSNPPSCTSKISYLRCFAATSLPRKLYWEAYGKQLSASNLFANLPVVKSIAKRERVPSDQ
jgi:hypothetical protein